MSRKKFYEGYTNQTLWPVFHSFPFIFTKPDRHISWRFFFNNGGTPLGSMLSCLRHCLSASRLSAERAAQIQFGDWARA
jgi:hypothetical protein